MEAVSDDPIGDRRRIHVPRNRNYLSKNPMGTMPLLELDDGTQLAESVAICRYIEELHPEPPLSVPRRLNEL
jgi:glutathione S-transferase